MFRKVNFTIKVDGISNGFIVFFENQHGISWEKRFCVTKNDIMKYIESQITTLIMKK